MGLSYFIPDRFLRNGPGLHAVLARRLASFRRRRPGRARDPGYSGDTHPFKRGRRPGRQRQLLDRPRAGPQGLPASKIPFLKQEYLERTEKFFEKYGGKTIIIARFVPIIRTFAPFLAGVGAMRYRRFLLYNVVGGLLWVFLLTLAGYYFGALEFVKENFSLVILGIIVVSTLPGAIEFLRHRKKDIL